jgi:hypothetical protein
MKSYSPIKGPQGAYIHVNKQLILTIKINNIYADQLNTVRVHALRTAHIYKQFTDKILIYKKLK